jgi:F0F1-type ATP synthase membrane subunit a
VDRCCRRFRSRHIHRERHQKRSSAVPAGTGNALEYAVEAIRDNIALPNFGRKWVNTWTPLILTFFVFIFSANLIGLIPIFDVLALLNHYGPFIRGRIVVARVTHGGTTATANYNVTAGSRDTFFAITSGRFKGARRHQALQEHRPARMAWPV